MALFVAIFGTILFLLIVNTSYYYFDLMHWFER
jgi:hypothetical protein